MADTKLKHEGRATLKRKASLRTLTNKLDGIFSRYIRYSHADGRGNCSCFTCDKVAPVAEMDCGHFVGRQHRATRWEEKNCHPQCRFCNRYCEGRKDVYAVRLVEKYGPHILFELQELKNSVVKLTPADLEEKIALYKAKLKEFEPEKKAA